MSCSEVNNRDKRKDSTSVAIVTKPLGKINAITIFFDDKS